MEKIDLSQYKRYYEVLRNILAIFELQFELQEVTMNKNDSISDYSQNHIKRSGSEGGKQPLEDGKQPLGDGRKPLILSVETSGRLGSVALGFGGELIEEVKFSGVMRHSAELFPALVGLLERGGLGACDIDQVYISVGPGSFTGLRIAVSMAKTMFLANKVKIVAVDTLDVIAANALDFREAETIGVVLDAKRGEFFVAVYERVNSAWVKTYGNNLLSAEDFVGRFGGGVIWVLGEGLVYYEEAFECAGVKIMDKRYWMPCATNVHKLGWQKALAGEFSDAISLEPAYLRRPGAKVKSR